MREPREARNTLASIARLWPLLGRCIAFHARLVALTGSVKAALMLSQAIYWTRRGRDVRQHGGWFFKTMEQWHEETGLSRHEQAHARATLRGLHLIDECKRGLPARLFYRVDAERLATSLSDSVDGRAECINWDDSEQVSALLGPVQSFHRCLSSVTGNVSAALFLSRALFFSRNILRVEPSGWFAKSAAQWQRETGLTWREQAAGRAILRDLGIAEETRKGIPPQVLMRINVDRVAALLSQSSKGSKTEASGLRPGAESAGGNPASQFCANRQTRMWESHILILRKAATLSAGKRNNSQPVCANLYIEKLITRSMSTKPLLPAASHEATDESAENGRGGADLIFPKALLPQEQAAAKGLVKAFPLLAQAMLDELAGRMETNTIRSSPIAYLRGLIARAKTGEFVAELGIRIAAARRARDEAEVLRRQQAENARELKVLRASPEYQARIERRREEMRRVLGSFGGQRRAGSERS
jgi:hypothetical protein